MASWVTGVGAAISIKLSSSIDDVVWLAPFLTSSLSHSTRMQNAIIYISVCLTQTIVAMAIAYSGDTLVALLTKNQENAWSTDKILTIFAGSMLALYSVKLTIEYIQEMNEEEGSTDDDKDSDNKYGQVSSETTDDEVAKPMCFNVDPELGSEEAEADSALQRQKKNEQKHTQTLFVIAFLGSVDDLTLFVPMLVGKGFDMFQLVIGGFVAASAIVMLCVFLGLCKPVADCLARVPLAAIVVVFAVVLLLKACTMD